MRCNSSIIRNPTESSPTWRSSGCSTLPLTISREEALKSSTTEIRHSNIYTPDIPVAARSWPYRLYVGGSTVALGLAHGFGYAVIVIVHGACRSICVFGCHWYKYMFSCVLSLIMFRGHTYMPVARTADSRQVAVAPHAPSARQRMPASVASVSDAVFRIVKLHIFSARAPSFLRFLPILFLYGKETRQPR